MNTYTMEGAVVDHPVVVYKYETDRAIHVSVTTWRGSNPALPYNPRNLPVIPSELRWVVEAHVMGITHYRSHKWADGYYCEVLCAMTRQPQEVTC